MLKIFERVMNYIYFEKNRIRLFKIINKQNYFTKKTLNLNLIKNIIKIALPLNLMKNKKILQYSSDLTSTSNIIIIQIKLTI